jgi:hypothetical protein
MKKTVCDTCGSENAKTYEHDRGRGKAHIDLCVNCVQEWVLKHQKKLSEVSNETNKKSIIHG